jgi:hypothetical protein
MKQIGSKLKYNLLSVALLMGCSSIPKYELPKDYRSAVDEESAKQQLNTVVEVSHSKEPEYVTAFLDSWDCDADFCVVGRAEIDADGASPFSCLEISKIKAKANLFSTVKTDLSQRVVYGMDGVDLDGQKLQSLTTSGFSIEGVSHVKNTNNYYRKLMRDVGGSPVGVYQCFSVVSLKKRELKRHIEREAKKNLSQQEQSRFQNRFDQIWESLFKLDHPAAHSVDFMEYTDENAMAPMHEYRRESGDLHQIQDNLVQVAKAFLGLPYQLGGSLGDGSLDCSNYMRQIFSTVDFHLPRISPDQFSDARGKPVRSRLEKGDLLFFNGSLRPRDQVSHVAMYIGNGEMIHASGESKKILVEDFSQPRWQRKFLGAKRFVTPENFATNQSRDIAITHWAD